MRGGFFNESLIAVPQERFFKVALSLTREFMVYAATNPAICGTIDTPLFLKPRRVKTKERR